MEGNYFARLTQVNVSAHVEKKGQFSYLSWPYAVAQLRLADPTASWEVRRFDGLPYLKTEAGHFVEVAVTVQGITLSQIHPVLDGKNRPIFEPTAFDINTSIQRCLVKAIALHGLGLYIYAGEDLPNAAVAADEPDEAQVAADMAHLQGLRDAALNGTEMLKLAWKAIDEATRTRLASELPSLKHSAIAPAKAAP